MAFVPASRPFGENRFGDVYKFIATPFNSISIIPLPPELSWAVSPYAACFLRE